jgi:rhodanese-related sulfurtransferase
MAQRVSPDVSGLREFVSVADTPAAAQDAYRPAEFRSRSGFGSVAGDGCAAHDGSRPAGHRSAATGPRHAERAAEAVRSGAVLVDIRSELPRRRDGDIPGAVCHPRNVLEWRVDPASGHSDLALGQDLTRRIIVVCDEGYQSSLAAATLQDLGFTKRDGSHRRFQAWRAACLPVTVS